MFQKLPVVDHPVVMLL